MKGVFGLSSAAANTGKILQLQHSCRAGWKYVERGIKVGRIGFSVWFPFLTQQGREQEGRKGKLNNPQSQSWLFQSFPLLTYIPNQCYFFSLHSLVRGFHALTLLSLENVPRNKIEDDSLTYNPFSCLLLVISLCRESIVSDRRPWGLIPLRCLCSVIVEITPFFFPWSPPPLPPPAVNIHEQKNFETLVARRQGVAGQGCSHVGYHSPHPRQLHHHALNMVSYE